MSSSKSSQTPSGAAPDAHRDLPFQQLLTLRSCGRTGWRCLRQLLEFRDFSHLARRLHISHRELQCLLQDLSAQLGDEHLRVHEGRIHLSGTLERAIQACAELPRAVSLPSSAHSPVLTPIPPDQPLP